MEKGSAARRPAAAHEALHRADSDGHQADNSSYQANLRALAYALFNIVSASSIVFANKAVFSVHLFRFTYSLTFLHTLVTLVGMMAFAAAGVFQPKKLPWAQVLPVAAAYVAYIVFGNLNLKLNSVSFYQIGKIAVAPAVLAIEAILYRRLPSLQVFGSVSVVCVGIAFATISELEGATGPGGAAVGVMAVLTTALYQVWVGAKQKQLGAGSMQLLHRSCPLSSLILAAVVVLLEPITPGPSQSPQDTITGFPYTLANLSTILVSAALGLAVSLSTFLVIGSTSSLTYNVVGHIKTVIIITGGVTIFGEDLPPKKMLGLCSAMVGIIAYSLIKIHEGTLVARQPSKGQ